MDQSAPSIWEKIDLDEYAEARAAEAAPPSTKGSPSDPETGWQRARKRAYWLTVWSASVAFWVYAPAKIFVGDVDRWIVSNVAPSLQWLLDFRFLVFLVFASFALVFFRKWIYLGSFLHIAFFPLIVVFFYIPRFLFRQRSWLPALGLLHATWQSVRSLRFAVVGFTIVALSTTFIALDAWSPVQAIAITSLIALWTILLLRACISAIRPVSFIQAQQRALSYAMSSKAVQTMASPAPGHMRADVVKLSKAQVDQVVMNASIAVCVYAAGYHLADQLEKYRKSSASIAFNALGIAALSLEAIALFTLSNYGLFQISPGQFKGVTDPSFALFTRYSVSAMFFSEIAALQPVGDIANWFSVYAGISFGVIFLVLVVGLAFSFRSTREDAAAEEAIAEMRKRSDSYAARLATEYELPMNELISRLIAMGGVVNLWIRFVSSSIGNFRNEDPGAHKGE